MVELKDRLRVVYLAGCGHSGSTLMALLMDCHPQVASVGETAIKPKIRRRGGEASQVCSCGASFFECPFWKIVFQSVSAQGFDFGPQSWSTDYRYENPLLNRLLTRHPSSRRLRSMQRLVARLHHVHRARLQRIDRINVAFIRSVLGTTGARVFFDTSKRSVRLSQLLGIQDLDVKVVKLVRDVRGYAASAKRRGLRVDAAAHAWKKDHQVIAEVTRHLPPERTFFLRYEDLCTDPTTWLHKLHGFCDVEVHEPPTTVVPREHHILGNSMRLRATAEIRLDESWRNRLGREEEMRVLRIAGTVNEQFGYR